MVEISLKLCKTELEENDPYKVAHKNISTCCHLTDPEKLHLPKKLYWPFMKDLHVSNHLKNFHSDDDWKLECKILPTL